MQCKDFKQKTLDKITKIKVKISVNSCRNCKYYQIYRELWKNVLVVHEWRIYCSTTFSPFFFFHLSSLFFFQFFHSITKYIRVIFRLLYVKNDKIAPKISKRKEVLKRDKEKFFLCRKNLEIKGKKPLPQKGFINEIFLVCKVYVCVSRVQLRTICIYYYYIYVLTNFVQQWNIYVCSTARHTTTTELFFLVGNTHTHTLRETNKNFTPRHFS